ncbi:DUF1934 domain-containing protein [Sporosalibacterium faouarense]|uniref:DUF1934 domain-containing protein n=1 Tax=Sporosalibacterium faouarense TaxID=516123 RepID=UPI00141CFCF9|nr:DUF1934 domain-containing protein [Sporosalibacterium faouarense]MTI48880.1 DUF1934 domain-containing protein [Bacillota bacterium]
MKEVQLTIKGKQTSVEGEVNNIEMVTEGKFYEKRGAYYIVYDESEITGMEGSTTTLRIEDNVVSMKRFGSNTSKLTFEKGKKHVTEYETVYGNMPIEVSTSKVDIDISELGIGSIDLAYRLDISGIIESTNKLLIQMK